MDSKWKKLLLRLVVFVQIFDSSFSNANSFTIFDLSKPG